eukprot:383523_1
MMNCNKKKCLGYYSVVCGVSIQLTLGLQYIVGNLLPYFASYIASKHENPNDEYKTQLNNLTYLYVVNTTFNNFFVLMGGKIERHIGIRYTTIVGIIFVESGIFLSYFTCYNFWLLLLTLGVINGIGIGLIYPMPLLCSMQWFPNHEGLVNGLILSGYGFSGVIFNSLSTQLINPNNVAINQDTGFLNTEVIENVPQFFIQLGLITAAILLICLTGLNEPNTRDYIEFSKDNMRDNEIALKEYGSDNDNDS